MKQSKHWSFLSWFASFEICFYAAEMFFCLIKFSPFPFCHPPLTDGWYRLEPLSKDTEKDHINTLDKCELLLVYICNIADLHDVSPHKSFKMFLSMKRKFSSALINTAILLLLILCCYLGKQVKYKFLERGHWRNAYFIAAHHCRFLTYSNSIRRPPDCRATCQISTVSWGTRTRSSSGPRESTKTSKLSSQQ